MARFIGGNHDEGSPFNFVATIAGSNQQVFRIARKSATLSFEGRRAEIFDYQDAPLAFLKKRTFAIGLKYRFFTEKADLFELHIKSSRLGRVMLVNGKEVAHMPKRWLPEHSQFAGEIGALFCLSFAPETRANDPVRPLLLAMVIASHRINLRTTIPIFAIGQG